MKIQKDLSEFIALLNSNHVDYVVVGGHAVAYHGYPRFTGDIDFLIRPSAENAARVRAVLQAFGFENTSDIEATLLEPSKVIQIGRVPNRIDLLTGISGVTFEEAYQSSIETEMDGLPIRLLGREALLKNKLASGRPKDLVDLEQIRQQNNSRDSD